MSYCASWASRLPRFWEIITQNSLKPTRFWCHTRVNNWWTSAQIVRGYCYGMIQECLLWLITVFLWAMLLRDNFDHNILYSCVSCTGLSLTLRDNSTTTYCSRPAPHAQVAAGLFCVSLTLRDNSTTTYCSRPAPHAQVASGSLCLS